MFIDAHNHLQDERLGTPEAVDELVVELRALGIGKAVVNGTRPEDWPRVRALADRWPDFVIPAFGLHPWHVNERATGWEQALEEQLDKGGAVGEVGLDKWIRGHDLDAQKDVMQEQMLAAAERNTPLSIHCLKAWGTLLELLEAGPLPACGFLLHSFGGPGEIVGRLAELGAHFSFSASVHNKPELLAAIPLERLLIETDAPDIPPPPEWNAQRIETPGDDRPLNHPANIIRVYEHVAKQRNMPVQTLAELVEANFNRLFGRG